MEPSSHVRISRLLSGLAALCLCALGQSQIVAGQTINSHGWIVPKSNSVPFYLRGRAAHTMYFINPSPKVLPWHRMASPSGPFQGGGIPGIHPVDLQTAYGIPTDRLRGAHAIAIVDAFDYTTALQDFNIFSKQFNLPMETSTNPTSSSNKVFQVVYEGGTQPPDATPTGWDVEESLDIEWAHAMAPNAKIYLVEGQDSSFTQLFGGIQLASGLTDVKEISNSWGSDEFPEETQFDSTYLQPVVNQVIFASSGDVGGAQSFPAESPFVVGVGGTHLDFDSTGRFLDEIAWDGSGGGPSSVEPTPSFQTVIKSIVGAFRGCPDVSAPASPDPGAALYNTANGGWLTVGGTSWACPVTAGVHNTRGSRTANALAELDSVYNKFYQKMTTFYRDITQGTAGPFQAMKGWDYITGIGSPVGIPSELPPLSVSAVSISALEGKASVTDVTKALSEVFRLDSITYDVASQFEPRLGTAASAQVTYGINTKLSSIFDLNLQVFSTAPPNATMLMYLFNFQTLSWDIISAKAATGKTLKYTADLFKQLIPTSGLSSYLNSKQQFRVLVRSLVPSRLGSAPYTLRIDYTNGIASR